MATGSKTDTYWNAQSVSYLPRTLVCMLFHWSHIFVLQHMMKHMDALVTWFKTVNLFGKFDRTSLLSDRNEI